MAEIKDLSTTDGNNNGLPSNAGFPENMSYSQVNNAARALEGLIARWFSDTNGTLTSGGSSNAYTLTPNRSVSAYTDGDCYLFEANHTNTGAATLNVSAVGAKSIVKPSGDALSGSEIQSGGRYLVSYDGTNFQLLAAIEISDSQVTTAKLADGAVTTAKIADDGVTYAKIQNVSATDKILGRSSAGSGVVEEIACTSAGRALLDDASASAQRTTLGLGTAATQADTRYNHRSNNLSDVSSASTARGNLGLGSIATRNVTVSTSAPSGGSDGDLWFVREA